MERKFLLFFRIVHELTPKIAGKSFKWTVEALAALHEGSEACVITILEKANLATIHAGHVTLMRKDIELAMKLSDVTENYKTTKSVTEVESEKDKKENEERRQKELEDLKKKRNPEKEDNGQLSGSGIVTPFRLIISDEDRGLDAVSEEEVVIRRGRKRQHVESSESEEESFQETPRKNVRCSKKLTKEQFDFFEANGFTDELITIVADEGWDRVDIENFILMYNFQNRKRVALLVFDRDKTIYGKRGKEDRSMDKKQNSGKNSNKHNGTKNDGKAGKSGSGGKGCSSKVQTSKNNSNKSKGTRLKKGETSKESKGGKSGTRVKTSSSEEEMSNKKDGKETKCTPSKKGDKSKESKEGESRSGGKKSSKLAKSRKEEKESEAGRSGKSTIYKDKSRKQKAKGKKSAKDYIEEPIVHFGTNEVGDLYREGRVDILEILSESESGDIGEVRERVGGGEMETVETDVQEVGESFRNENVERVGSGNGLEGSGETEDITGDNGNTGVENLENVSAHGNVDNEVLEDELKGQNREQSEHRSVEMEDGSNTEHVQMQDGRNTEDVEDGIGNR